MPRRREQDPPLPPGGMARKVIYMEPQDVAALEVLADLLDVSASELIREAWQTGRAELEARLSPDEKSLFERLLQRKLGADRRE